VYNALFDFLTLKLIIKRTTPINREKGPEIKPTNISGQCWILKRAPTMNNRTPKIMKTNAKTLVIFMVDKLNLKIS
jgi:hypothetical protein